MTKPVATHTQHLPEGTREIVFAAGEIDCREGIPGALRKGRYNSLVDAAYQTAEAYMQALEAMAKQYNLRFLVLPVLPPVSPINDSKARIVACFNEVRCPWCSDR